MVEIAFKRIGVIGGGAWGTALATTLAEAGHDLRLWAFETETVDEINNRQTNEVFLPGITLQQGIVATSDFADMADRDLLLLVMPSQHLRQIVGALKPNIEPDVPLLICAKGIEQQSGKLLGDVLTAEMPGVTYGVVSGPSFAGEVARGLPVALTVACANENLGKRVAKSLGGRALRLYWSSDLAGVQLGGAIKNVLAIAAGIVDGKKLGANAHAAVVTRGFAEMRRLGSALGARPETLSGLSGLGDLVLTCGSTQSRNMSLGRALGEGQSLDDILGSRRSVTEGVYTAQAVVQLASERGVELPISTSVKGVVDGRLTVDEAIAGLMARPLRSEIES